MAWQQMQTMDENYQPKTVWYDTETGNYTDVNPNPSSGDVFYKVNTLNEGTQTPDQYVNLRTLQQVGEQRPGAGQVFENLGEVYNFNNPFWQNKFSNPQGTHWLQAYQDILNTAGMEGINAAAQQGFFNRFPSFNDPADWQSLQARYGTSQDAGGLWGSSPGDFIGRNVAENQAGYDAAFQEQNLQIAKIAASVFGGMLASGSGTASAGAEAGAGASEAGVAGVSASGGPDVTQMGLSGGLTGNALGAPGLASGGFNAANLGAGGASAAPGLTVPSAGVSGAGALSPGFFAGETLYPTFGGVSAASAPGTSLASPNVTQSGLTSVLANPQVLGALGGAALAAGLGGSGSNAKTIETEEGIPDWLMPYVKPQLDKYSTELQNYQVDPYGIMPDAMQQFKNTIGGMYLDPSTNKYLEDYFRLGAERIKGSLSPTFGHMQAFGQHSGYNEALSRGLGDYAVGLYGGAYEKERDRQNQMVAAAPAFLGQSSQAAFNPYTQYLQSISGLGKKKEEPYYTNQFGNILGGAMFGSQFGKAFA